MPTGERMSLRVVPCTRDRARSFIRIHHRHHAPPLGAVFYLACADQSGVVRGVASVGRPVARRMDDGFTLEVNRVATDGARNACSLLLGAARRVAFSLGYDRIITYTLPKEGGSSLKGAGWVNDRATRGRDQDWASRPGRDSRQLGVKWRWVSTRPKADPVVVVWPKADSAHPCLWGEE